MSKRKAEVNNIIYELDSGDLSSSSDEDKNIKKLCSESHIAPVINETSPFRPEDSNNDSINTVETDPPCNPAQESSLSTFEENGGKSPMSEIQVTDIPIETDITEGCTTKMDPAEIVNTSVNDRKDAIICNNDSLTDENQPNPPDEVAGAVILNEDMDTDSQSSLQNVPIGCANRSPLVSMTFKNKKLAKDYKQKIKEFMLKLIKLHDEDSLTGSESETDLELDIWPEDLVEKLEIDEENATDADANFDNLFFVDTDAGFVAHNEVPQYCKTDSVLSDQQPEEPESPVQQRRGPSCFNCDGAHPLRDCTLPRNNAKINEKRKAVNANRTGRYHVEDEQKFGHLVPGRVSGALRHALGLRRDELPLHVYRMRLLGYPPGWLQDARISHSGITMFDSQGQAIQDPEEEEGEVCEAGSKDKYDIKKILDFPGFNVPASSRYKEDAHRYGLPPMSEEDSKLNMLLVLAPNAMKAYKRKKLTFFPSASSPNCTILGQAEMELDDDDEQADFPSVPPLPDEAPPPAPPPPPPPPSPPSEDKSEDKSVDKSEDSKSDDVVVLDVTQVKDIPVPEVPTINIDGDDSNTRSSGGRDSPSLQDLETKKRLLLEALENPSSSTSSPATVSNKTTEVAETTSIEDLELKTTVTNEIDKSVVETTAKSIETPVSKETPQSPIRMMTGQVKATSYGTPILNTASPYSKLPSDNKFSKDICDVINFENLPDSTGKYGKISTLLKRVKSEVDRIQDL